MKIVKKIGNFTCIKQIKMIKYSRLISQTGGAGYVKSMLYL